MTAQEATELGLVGRLFLAMLAGIVLGVPYRRTPGGIRTHLLVTLGAALFCVTGQDVAQQTQTDLLRVIQGIASGIGFVGAASVLKRGGAIFGLTTAASIWIAAAVGCGMAIGNPLRTALITVVIAATSMATRYLERSIIHRRRTVSAR